MTLLTYIYCLKIRIGMNGGKDTVA